MTPWQCDAWPHTSLFFGQKTMYGDYAEISKGANEIATEV